MYEDEDSEFELELPEILRQQRESEEAQNEADGGGDGDEDYGDISNIIQIDMEKMADLEARANERASSSSDMQGVTQA